MTIVAEAGPLIALAKIGDLAELFALHPLIITPPAVFEETVREGRYVPKQGALGSECGSLDRGLILCPAAKE